MFEIRRSIMAKMIDLWNFNKLTTAWTKMEFGKLIDYHREISL